MRPCSIRKKNESPGSDTNRAAPPHRPNWAQRTSSYICLRPLSPVITLFLSFNFPDRVEKSGSRGSALVQRARYQQRARPAQEHAGGPTLVIGRAEGKASEQKG